MQENSLLFLGTGTSTGVPAIGCTCPACTSLDPLDKRMRTSALLSFRGKNILIDCGPDLRTQLLRAGSPSLDALLVTHIHYDHVAGIDDLRPYCYRAPMPVYCRQDVADGLKRLVPYSFDEHPYPGVPTFDLHVIDPARPFLIGDIEVTPLPVMHYKMPILGYRIGPLAYVTDCKTMPPATLDLIRGVDTLVLNGLRMTEHMSHLSVPEAVDLIGKIAPRRAYITHISHDLGPAASVVLPQGISLAHDFLKIEI